MAEGSIQKLQDSGVAVDQLSPEQQAVLAGLSDDEVATLIRVNSELQAAGGGASGGLKGSGTGVFYY